MKKILIAACAMVAAFAAVADDAMPPLRLAGFAICDKVDAEVCKVRGLSAPEKVVVDKQGTVFYRCKTAAPTDGFDEVQLVLSSDRRIVSVIGVLRFGDEAACTRRAKELAAKYKAELAKRETAAGTMVFEVRYGRSYVEVELASAAHQRLAAKAVADW